MINESNKAIKETIKDIISKVTRIEAKKITDHASLRDDLYIDSLQATQIIILIQDRYKIKIDEVEIFNVDNVGDIIDLIKEYTSLNN